MLNPYSNLPSSSLQRREKQNMSKGDIQLNSYVQHGRDRSGKSSVEHGGLERAGLRRSIRHGGALRSPWGILTERVDGPGQLAVALEPAFERGELRAVRARHGGALRALRDRAFDGNVVQLASEPIAIDLQYTARRSLRRAVH
jgi:hypothetical protein